MLEKLSTYHKKRNFDRTPEPAGTAQSEQDQAQYIMHKHAASHDHFDLRLEQDGVLRSWALPKGPSLEPGEKRLAVEVEAHPLAYGSFEGVIPKNQYGGGTVMLWDQGHWRLRGKLKADKVDFELQGQKLKGHWTLVKIHGKPSARSRKDNNWLLIKRSDAGQPALPPDDCSVVSGRTMAEIARGDDARPVTTSMPNPASLEDARLAAMPDAAPPQLATLTESAPTGDNWVHEIKFDGYRLLARLDRGQVTLTTRNGKNWTRRFPELAATLAELPVESALLDGEVASFDQDGASNFRRLQDRLGSAAGPGSTQSLVYQAFDLLYLNGYDLQRSPLLARKAALLKVLAPLTDAGDRVRYSDHFTGQGPAFLAQACELGLEGIVSKKASAGYRSGRQRAWRKTKCTAQEEFVVGGFTHPSGARRGFGALLLGAFDGDRFTYVGRVGSGFSTRQLTNLQHRLQARLTQSCPFADPAAIPDQTGVQWVAPELVVDVAFTERTGSGALRHPVYRGLREDKDAAEVVMPDRTPSPASTGKPGTKPAATRRRDKPVIAGVTVTHPERILYPEQGITKLDVARYYEAVQDWILPHLMNRPLALLRCPEGWDADCFFQKHPGATLTGKLPRVAIAEKQGGTSNHVYVTSVTDLVTLAQFGVLELHPWGSLMTDVEAPDTLIFDLDPAPDVPWRQIARAAVSLRDRLQTLGLNGFLQATGGKGLHIVVPILPDLSWDTAKAFAHAVSQAHAQDDPTAFTTKMAKSKRHGKIFLDYLRNGRGSTSIARYSLRARENAPVATPLRWNELTPSARSNRYTIHTVRRRLSALKTDPWAGYAEARAPVTASARKQVGLE